MTCCIAQGTIYFVITYNGKEYEKSILCVTKSLCTLETNIILFIYFKWNKDEYFIIFFCASILYTFSVYTSIFHFSIWVSIYFKSGIEPVYPELADKFLSTGPTGSLAFLVLRDLWGIQSDSSWVAPQPVWRSLCGQLTRLIL